MAAGAAKGGLKCMQVCGYCCQAVACGVDTVKTIWEVITKVCTCGQGWKGLFYNTTTICNSEEDPDDKDFELPVATERRITDTLAILIFLAILVGMCVAMNRGISLGKPEVFNNGVDSWSNICGSSNNVQFDSIKYSGIDMTKYSKVLIFDFLNNPRFFEDQNLLKDITLLCVQVCPTISSNFSCAKYFSSNTGYKSSLYVKICRPSIYEIAFTEKNQRCFPLNLLKGFSIQRLNVILNLYGDNWLHNLVHDCKICAAELTWLILISVGFTFLFVIVIQSAATGLCWFSFAIFFVVGISAVGAMWYLFSLISAIDKGLTVGGRSYTHATEMKVNTSEENSFESSVANAALHLFSGSLVPSSRVSEETVPQAGYSVVFRDASICGTCIVVLLCIVCIALGRRNIDACAFLFEEAVSSLLCIQWIYLLPIYSLLTLTLTFGLWMYTITSITAIFLKEPNATSSQPGNAKGSYIPDTNYSTWVLIFQFLSIIWVFNFIVACQQIITSLSVGTWYFTIDKTDFFRPVRVASSRLIRRHLGSAITGSFFVGFFGMLRAPLGFLQTRVVSNMQYARKLKYQEQNKSFNSAGPAPSGVGQKSGAGKQSESDSYYSYEEVKPPKKKVADSAVAYEVWKKTNSACSPLFWLLNNVLVYISDLNYAMIALEGNSFIQSGLIVRDRLNENEHLKGIPAIYSFALFLGKITVTLTVLPIGFLLLKDKKDVFMYGHPLAVGALLSFLIAHVIISLYESAVGALFVCYLEDVSINIGTDEAPYFGRKQFFKKFESALNELTSIEAKQYNKVHHGKDIVEPRSQIRRRAMKQPRVDDSSDDTGSEHSVPKKQTFNKKKKENNRSKKPIIKQPQVKDLSESSGYSEIYKKTSNKKNKKTFEKTSKSKKEKSSPIFELMPKKRQAPAPPRNIYDDVYTNSDEWLSESDGSGQYSNKKKKSKANTRKKEITDKKSVKKSEMRKEIKHKQSKFIAKNRNNSEDEYDDVYEGRGNIKKSQVKNKDKSVKNKKENWKEDDKKDGKSKDKAKSNASKADGKKVVNFKSKHIYDEVYDDKERKHKHKIKDGANAKPVNKSRRGNRALPPTPKQNIYDEVHSDRNLKTKAKSQSRKEEKAKSSAKVQEGKHKAKGKTRTYENLKKDKKTKERPPENVYDDVYSEENPLGDLLDLLNDDDRKVKKQKHSKSKDTKERGDKRKEKSKESHKADAKKQGKAKQIDSKDKKQSNKGHAGHKDKGNITGEKKATVKPKNENKMSKPKLDGKNATKKPVRKAPPIPEIKKQSPSKTKLQSKVKSKPKHTASSKSAVKTKQVAEKASTSKSSKLKLPKAKSSKIKTFEGSKTKLGKGLKGSKNKLGKELKGSKMKLGKGLKGSKSKLGKGLKGSKMKLGKGLKGSKSKLGKGLKGSKMKLGNKLSKGFKVPKVRASGTKVKGGKGGADIAGGIEGAMNVTDGLLRITGTKKIAENKAQKAAFGSRNRSKFTTLTGHIANNRYDALMNNDEGFFSGVAKPLTSARDLIVGGKKILQDIDQDWDEMEEDEEEYSD